MKKFGFSFIAMATALAFGPVAAAGAQNLCPNAPATDTYGTGSYSVTSVAGTSDATCGPNSAVKLQISNDTDYARLEWTQGTGGVPAGLTLGALTGLDGSVNFAKDQPGDQPFFMITVNDSTDNLGLTHPTDQLMFIEFQPTTLVGTNMAASASTTLFNMYDNTTGVYLNQANGGQQDAQTLDAWLTLYPELSSEAITSLRIGIGMDGGCGSVPCTETAVINSLDVNPPVPAPEGGSGNLYLLLAGAACFAALVLGRRWGSASAPAN